jgi:hypothetical protein
MFDAKGILENGSPENAVETLRQANIPELRLSIGIEPWLQSRERAAERKRLRWEYEQKVQTGEWPEHETLVPLFPYQREGMLHLAFTERALLADEMGLGKTIQAIAACALLHRLGKAQRVLVVTPASLKTEWEEQIQRFTTLPLQLVYGAKPYRLKAYQSPPFFTIVNYEQMLGDVLDVNKSLRPDIVVLDEAQRIKNWDTKTSQAIKRLHSRYAFVLTGTPIENRIDEIHSLMSFLNPNLLGPLFRFNREFYQFDDRGRPAGFKNLDKLHERIRTVMLRRRKADVETELPDRTDRNFFVPLSDEQRARYQDHEKEVARLMGIAKHRPLTMQQQEKLMRELNMMRMCCDTNYILDEDERACPKLKELEKIFEETRENEGVKVIVFSEWVRMLELARDLCKQVGLGYAWHTGTVPQRRRRAEIQLFKTDPNCRVFLSTDSGSTGLNLQNASIVINCDLPWNPAKLEQRIARAWRKHQTRSVTVLNLVSEGTIEHRMLETLANKQALSDGVLDRKGNLTEIKLHSGRQAFLKKLELLVSADINRPSPPRKQLPSDRSLAFAVQARETLGANLISCEEQYPEQGAHTVLLTVVERDAETSRTRLVALHDELFGVGKSDPLCPVQLDVIDRATHDVLKRLIAAGVIAPVTRAVRALFPGVESTSTPPPLTAEEQKIVTEQKQQAARKLKMGEVLGTAGLAEESRVALLDAIMCMARMASVERRLRAPIDLSETLIPPLSHAWGDSLAAFRCYINEGKTAPDAIMKRLNELLHAPAIA